MPCGRPRRPPPVLRLVAAPLPLSTAVPTPGAGSWGTASRIHATANARQRSSAIVGLGGEDEMNVAFDRIDHEPPDVLVVPARTASRTCAPCWNSTPAASAAASGCPDGQPAPLSAAPAAAGAPPPRPPASPSKRAAPGAAAPTPPSAHPHVVRAPQPAANAAASGCAHAADPHHAKTPTTASPRSRGGSPATRRTPPQTARWSSPAARPTPPQNHMPEAHAFRVQMSCHTAS
jgi:hypothetical protein